MARKRSLVALTLLSAAAGLAAPPASAKVVPDVGPYYGRTANHLVETEMRVIPDRARSGRRYSIEGNFSCYGGEHLDFPTYGRYGPRDSRGLDVDHIYVDLGASESTFRYRGKGLPTGGYGVKPGRFTLKGTFRRSRVARITLRAERCYENRRFRFTVKRCDTARECNNKGGPPIPEIFAEGDCLNEGAPLVHFDAEIHGGPGPPIDYLWRFGVDGATSTETDPFHEYPSAGTYTVRLTLTDRTGGKATRSKEIRAPSC